MTIPVGSHPASANKLGHEDLHAGLRETVRETVRDAYSKAPQTTLIQLTDDEILTPPEISSLRYPRVVVGGSRERSFLAPPGYLEDTGNSIVGFRCARDE